MRVGIACPRPLVAWIIQAVGEIDGITPVHLVTDETEKLSLGILDWLDRRLFSSRTKQSAFEPAQVAIEDMPVRNIDSGSLDLLIVFGDVAEEFLDKEFPLGVWNISLGENRSNVFWEVYEKHPVTPVKLNVWLSKHE